MKTTFEYQYGLVAVLDALGASNYSDKEIHRFIRSREIVLDLLNEKVEDLELDRDAVTTFTFNDTVLIVLNTGSEPATIKAITSFFKLLRKFIVDSLENKIMFRGTVAEGGFYANDETNTVMGQAVTDAAAWYDKADWIGVHSTPRTSLVISKWLATEERQKMNLMIDYDVPMRSGGVVHAKVVNWPKGFFIRSISPCVAGQSPRAKVLELLTEHQVPKGTESKFENTLAFFDYAAQLEDKQQQKRPNRPTKARG